MREEIETTGSGTAPETDTAGTVPSGSRSEVAVHVRGLTKRYGADVEALRDVTIAFQRGTITGLLGSNGAGKTTLLKSVLGLVIPTEGSVTVDGVDVSEAPAEVHGRAAAVFEGARNVYWRLTARENASLFARLHGVSREERPERVERAIETVGLGDASDVPVGELSRGMQQRCALACALVRDASVLVLDEPTVGLDRDSREDVARLLGRLVERDRRTVILSSHDTDLIERVCDRVVVVDRGRAIVDAPVAELRAAFATRTCSVTLEGNITPEDAPIVTRSFETADWRRDRDRTTFEVVLPEHEDVYSLVDRLRTLGLPLLAIENAAPDVGSIFASIANALDDPDEVDG